MLTLPTLENQVIRTLYVSEPVSNVNGRLAARSMKHLYVVTDIMQRHTFFQIEVVDDCLTAATLENAIDVFNSI